MKVKGENYSFATRHAHFYSHYMIESHYLQLYISTCISHNHIGGNSVVYQWLYVVLGG